MVLTPAAAFVSMGGQVQVMPERVKELELRHLKLRRISVLQHAEDPSYKFAAAAKVGDGTILEVDTGVIVALWLVDGTGNILRSSFKDTSQARLSQLEREYSDYRSVDGVLLPFKIVTKDNGEVAAETTVKEIKLNPAVDPKLFDKP